MENSEDRVREYQQHELEEAVLQMLQSGDNSLGGPMYGLAKKYSEKLKVKGDWAQWRIVEVLWELQRRGLVFFNFAYSQDITGANPEKWQVMPTERGKIAAGNPVANPDMPKSYLEQFVREIPLASDVVRRYLKEAVETYTQQCYLASAVMLGVAGETAFMEMAESFSTWLGPSQNKTLADLLGSTRSGFSSVLREVQAKLSLDEISKGLPADLREGMGIQVTAVADMIRNYRNDAGHAKASEIDRKTCHVTLAISPTAIERMYKLKQFFDSGSRSATP